MLRPEVLLALLGALVHQSVSLDDAEARDLLKKLFGSNPQKTRRAPNFDTALYKQTCENGDIALVIDSSSSIPMRSFLSGKKFLKDFTSLFNVGPDTIRFAAVTYGRGVYAQDAFSFEEYTNNQDLSRAILGLTHRGGDWTSTGEGIRFMRETLMSSARTNVERIAIVITDGNSQEPEITEAEANLAKNSDITVFAIGVGSQISDAELNRIASSEDYILKVDDYDSLNKIKEILDRLICKAITIRQCGKGDISLVIDSSSSIDPYDYEKGLKFLSTFASTFKIGPNNIRVSAVSYGNEVYVEDAFDFGEHSSVQSIKDAVESMPFRAGTRTETGMALKYMREHQMSLARPNVNHTAIVITDGNSQEPEKTANEAAKTHASKISVFAIGVGPDISEEELRNIASKKEYVMMVDDYDSLESIKDLLQFSVCDEISEEPCSERNPSDIYFVYDGDFLSSSIVEDIDVFIRHSISSDDLSSGMQVGVISGLCAGMRGFPLRQYNNAARLSSDLVESELQSDLSALVNYLHSEAYNVENGGRPSANKVAVIFVDAKVNIQELRAEVDIAKAAGISVFVVGIGNSNFQDLAFLSSQPPSRYVLTGQTVIDTARDFVDAICRSTQ